MPELFNDAFDRGAVVGAALQAPDLRFPRARSGQTRLLIARAARKSKALGA